LWLKWQGGERILDVRPPGLVVPEKGKERKYENRVKAKKNGRQNILVENLGHLVWCKKGR
jgi:hypothetical protein